MKRPRNLILSALTLLVACSTHRVSLSYESHGLNRSADHQQGVVVGQFRDERGEDAQRGGNPNWIGAIRNGYGGSAKTLLTEQPLSDVVAKAFADGLASRRLLADGASRTYLVLGAIRQFAC